MRPLQKRQQLIKQRRVNLWNEQAAVETAATVEAAIASKPIARTTSYDMRNQDDSTTEIEKDYGCDFLCCSAELLSTAFWDSASFPEAP